MNRRGLWATSRHLTWLSSVVGVYPRIDLARLRAGLLATTVPREAQPANLAAGQGQPALAYSAHCP
jgi:hypothetical protein